MDVAGVWSDLDWEEEAALDNIGYDYDEIAHRKSM